MATVAERWQGTGGLREDQRAALSQAFGYMQNAYMDGPWALPPEQLMAQLREIDPSMLQDLIGQIGWEVIAGVGYTADAEGERQRAVSEAQRLYKYSPLAQWCIWLWTGWGLGDRVVITANDPEADQWWQEFWTANRNAPLLGDGELDDTSNFLLTTGERFLVYYAGEAAGLSTVRSIVPTEIVKVLTNPADKAEPWFYERQYMDTKDQMQTIYYPDWQLYLAEDKEKANEAWGALSQASNVDADAARADLTEANNESGTIALMQFICHNRKDESIARGWPISLPAGPWVRSHQTYMQNRLTSSTAIASTIKRYTVSGGSRAMKAVQARFQSALSRNQYTDTNPPPPGGTSEVINKAMSVRDLAMKTGGADAKADNDMFTWMALIGLGTTPVSAGLDTQRFATAMAMDKAQSMVFQSYQSFWSASWKKSVQIVLGIGERFGNQTFKDKTAEVSIDSFSLSDFPSVAESIGKLVQEAMVPFVADGTIPKEAAKPILQRLLRLNLQALGVTDADLTSNEAFLIGVPEPETTEPTDEEPETTVEQIAAMVRENVEAGSVNKQDAALWALAELIEG